MKTILTVLAVVAGISLATFAEMQKIADWCSMDVPAEAKVDQALEIKVQLNGVQAGTKVKADLHWMKKDGTYGGFNVWGGKAQDVKEDGLHTFTMKPAAKEDMGAVHVLLYLSPTGDYSNLTQKVVSPNIKIVE